MSTQHASHVAINHFRTGIAATLYVPDTTSWIQRSLMKMTAVFWDTVPCTPVEVYRSFRCTYCLHHQGTSETSVNFRQTTRRSIPSDSHLNTRSRKSLKSRQFSLIYRSTVYRLYIRIYIHHQTTITAMRFVSVVM